MSKSDHAEKLQPRDGETDGKADSGLREVDDDSDADDSAHVMCSEWLTRPEAITQRTVVACFRRGDLIGFLT